MLTISKVQFVSNGTKLMFFNLVQIKGSSINCVVSKLAIFDTPATREGASIVEWNKFWSFRSLCIGNKVLEQNSTSWFNLPYSGSLVKHEWLPTPPPLLEMSLCWICIYKSHCCRGELRLGARVPKGKRSTSSACPSLIYSWSISHILKHEFFCFGHLGSSGQ